MPAVFTLALSLNREIRALPKAFQRVHDDL